MNLRVEELQDDTHVDWDSSSSVTPYMVKRPSLMHPTKQKNDLMKYWVEDMNGAKLLTLSQNVQIVYVTLPANQNTMFQGKMKKGEDETTSSKPYGRVNKLFGDKHVNA